MLLLCVRARMRACVCACVSSFCNFGLCAGVGTRVRPWLCFSFCCGVWFARSERFAAQSEESLGWRGHTLSFCPKKLGTTRSRGGSFHRHPCMCLLANSEVVPTCQSGWEAGACGRVLQCCSALCHESALVARGLRGAGEGHCAQRATHAGGPSAAVVC